MARPRAWRVALLAPLVTLGLAACGGGSGSSAPDISVSANGLALDVEVLDESTGATKSGRVIAAHRTGSVLSYSISSPPRLGTATIDTATGVYTYTLANPREAESDGFEVMVSAGGAASVVRVDVRIARDPLFANQWHLRNTGQDAFSSARPDPGNDANVFEAWKAGASGRGIKIAIVDTGLEVAHPDLRANVDTAASENFVRGRDSFDPSPVSSGPDHGTEVAGVAAAVAFNNAGGRGVAFRARLRGYNLLEQQSLESYVRSFGGPGSRSTDNDVWNFSAAFAFPVLPATDLALTAIADNLRTLRGGLGALLVQAAGNEFGGFPGLTGAENDLVCGNARRLGVSCGVPAVDSVRGSVVSVVVGATGANGRKSSYGNSGPGLWISAPGGEFGRDAAFQPGLAAIAYQPAIITTARSGCANALLPIEVNRLDSLGANPFARSCEYTALANGTSAATPVVAGVIALMLEANPKLGFRDLKRILAQTAKIIDASMAPISDGSVIAEQGWVKNAAGILFNNWYGFGQVDAARAVAAARGYTAFLPPQQTIGPVGTTLSGTVPKGAAGLTRSFSVSADVSIEDAAVGLHFSTPQLRCNQIELVAPSGTKSILLHLGNGMLNTEVSAARINSNAFYGERSAGLWRLSIFDFCNDAPATTLAEKESQTLTLTGH